MDFDEKLVEARAWLRKISWEYGQALRVWLTALGVVLARARGAAGERLADARWTIRADAADRAQRFRVWREDVRTSSQPGERLAYAWWQVRKSAIDLAGAARLFRAQHRRASTVAMICLLLSLALAGTGAAFLADSESSAAGNGISTSYVVVTGPGGTRTYAVTVTDRGKGQTVLRVVHGPGGVTTLRHTVSVDGPLQVLPGQTITTKGPVKTVTVKGPSVTVTQTETQVVTETVTVINDVTVTVEGPPPPPSP
jgi:hypothetical protein